MTTPGTDHGLLAWRRLLLVLPVLLGVLVMHGLTSNHDIGMPSAAGHGHSTVAPRTPDRGHNADAMRMGGPRHDVTAAPPAVAVGDATHHAGHDMGPVCLGELTVSVLALVLARAPGRGRPSVRPLLPTTASSPGGAPPGAAPYAPSLTRLCISRT